MKTKTYYFSKPIICLLVMLVLSGCSKKEPIVAEIDDEPITLEEFKIGYLNVIKKPDVFDSESLREQFLDEFIRNRLIAQEAYRMKLDTNERIEYKVNAYHDKMLREQHYNAIIKPQISVTEFDVEEIYLFSQEERRVSNLFFKTKREADSVYTLLKQGTKFNDVAAQIYSDEKMKKSGGDLGWVNWDQMDYDMAQAAFRQVVDSISAPIKSSFGYHIIKVTDFKRKPLITRQEYEQHRKKAKYMLEYKIGDKLALEHIRTAAKNSDVKIDSEVFWFMNDKLADKFKRRPTQFDQMYDLQLKEDEVHSMETSLWDERNQVIATIDGKLLTIGQVLGSLNYVPYEILHSNFKNSLDVVIRDFILTEEAKKMGLDDNPEVRRKVKLFEEYFLQLDLRRQFVRNIKVSDGDIEKYYNLNKARFKLAKYDDVYPIIKKILTGEKKRSVIPEFTKSLARNKNIKKYPEVIHEYYNAQLKGGA